MQRIEFEPRRLRRVAVVTLGSMLWGVALCAAQGTQEAPSPDASGPPTLLADQMVGVAAASVAQTPGQPSWMDERRACEGCPPRSVGRALFQTTVVNVMYGVANQRLGSPPHLTVLSRSLSTGKFMRRSNNCHRGSEWRLSNRGSVFT